MIDDTEKKPDAQPPAAPPAEASVTLPVGQEFQVAVHHQNIAERLGLKVEEVFFELVHDIETGVHTLIGKPAA